MINFEFRKKIMVPVMALFFFHAVYYINFAFAAEPSVEEMVAQMLMVGFRGTKVNEHSAIVKHIRAGFVGNVVLFDKDMTRGAGALRNVQSPAQLKELIATLKGANPYSIPLWAAIDQEGGKVQRLRPERGFAAEFPTAQSLGNKDASFTQSVADKIGQELRNMGIDLNFAPVADLNINPESPAIGRIERSFGDDPNIVTKHVLAYAEGMRKAGVLPCLKHFPGHGSAKYDTHDGVTNITYSWRGYELLPYREVLKSNWIGAIMSSHVYHEALDPEYPASLSYNITTNMLREVLGWKGLIITDDLQMSALTYKYDINEIIYLAIKAGADILMFSCNAKGTTFDPDLPEKAHQILVKLVLDGKVSKKRLHESWERIIALKIPNQ
jgi:beta-N-acetylhexosaminidase